MHMYQIWLINIGHIRISLVRNVTCIFFVGVIIWDRATRGISSNWICPDAKGGRTYLRTHKTHSDCAIYQYFIFNTGLPLDFLEERAWNICPKYPAVLTVSPYKGSFSDNPDQGVTTSAGSRIESQNLTPICGADKSCLW